MRRTVPAAAAAIGTTLLLLTGCSGAVPDRGMAGASPTASAPGGEAGATGNKPTSSSGGTTGSAPAGPPAPADATAALRTKVTEALGRLAADAPKPSTAQVRDALTGAGVAAGSLEVSESTTPTGLAADSVEAAVRHAKECVIGQVREGAVTVTVLPVLASGKCFVGS